MKKYFLLFALILIFSIPACGGKSENQKIPEQDDADETAETEQNDEDSVYEEDYDWYVFPDDEDCNDCALPPACSIDDSYTSSGFDNYYIFKGKGLINNETNITNIKEYTSNTSKSSLYLEHQPDYSLNAMNSFLFDTTMDSGQESVSLVNMGLDNSGIFPNVYLQAFILKEWLENPSGKLPFAPIITVFSGDFHTTSSGKLDWYKMCTIAISVYTPSELSESVLPEGSFQYCAEYGDGGLIESGQIKPGQFLELGIDARLTDNFEDIQSAYNEGLLGINDILVETPEDLCRCYSNTADGDEEIDCPDKQSDEDSEQNDADVEEEHDATSDSELNDCDAETPEQPDGDMPLYADFSTYRRFRCDFPDFPV